MKTNSKKLMLQAAVLAACVGPATALMAQVTGPGGVEEVNQVCTMQIMQGQAIASQLEMPYLAEILQFRERNERVLRSYIGALDGSTNPRVLTAAAGLLNYNRRLTRLADRLAYENSVAQRELPLAHAREIAPLLAAFDSGVAEHTAAIEVSNARFNASSIVMEANGLPAYSTNFASDAPAAARDAGSYYGTTPLAGNNCGLNGAPLELSGSLPLAEARASLTASMARYNDQLQALNTELASIRRRGPNRRSAAGHTRRSLEESINSLTARIANIRDCYLPNLPALEAIVASAEARHTAEVAEHTAAIDAIRAPGTDVAAMRLRHTEELRALRERAAQIQLALRGREAAAATATAEAVERLYGLREMHGMLNNLLVEPASRVSTDLLTALNTEYPEHSCTYTAPGDSVRHLTVSEERGRDRGLSIAPLSLGLGRIGCTALDRDSMSYSYPGFNATGRNTTRIRVCNGLPATSATTTRYPEYRSYQVCSSIDLADASRGIVHETEFLNAYGTVVDPIISQLEGPECFRFYNEWREGRESLRDLPEGSFGGIDLSGMERSLRAIGRLLGDPESAEPAPVAPAAPAAEPVSSAESASEAPVAEAAPVAPTSTQVEAPREIAAEAPALPVEAAEGEVEVDAPVSAIAE